MHPARFIYIYELPTNLQICLRTLSWDERVNDVTNTRIVGSPLP